MSRKKIGLIVAGVLGFFLCLWGLNHWAENRVEKELNSVLGKSLSYENMGVDLLRGRIVLEAPRLDLKNFRLTADGVAIKGIGYLDFISNNKIVIQRIEVDKPEVHIYTREPDTSETSGKFRGDISIGNFNVSDGKLHIAATDSTPSTFYAGIAQLHLKEILITENSVKEKLPFSFEEYEVKVDSLFLDLDKEHYLSVGEIGIKEEVLEAVDLRIIPRFSKAAFQEQNPFEKDWYDLSMESVTMDSLQWGFANDSLYMRNHLLSLKNARLEVYRSKLLRDDPREKTLYGEKIRNLPIKLDLKIMEVSGSEILYEELIDAERGPALVYFTGVHGKIYNLSNTGMDAEGFPRTEVDAKAQLMGEAPLDFHLEFDVGDVDNRYSFNGSAGALSSPGINTFLKPALNIETEGGIKSLDFAFAGNEEGATGDMQLQYEDFRISILRDGGKNKNGILSAVVNLFVNNKAMNEEAVHKNLVVERDKTKSFWNLVWSCIEKGAIKTLL